MARKALTAFIISKAISMVFYLRRISYSLSPSSHQQAQYDEAEAKVCMEYKMRREEKKKNNKNIKNRASVPVANEDNIGTYEQVRIE